MTSVLKPFGFGGIQQYLLDIRFTVKVCRGFMSDRTDDSFMELCRKGLKAYSKDNKEKAKQIKVLLPLLALYSCNNVIVFVG